MDEGTFARDKFKTFVSNTVSPEARHFQTEMAEVWCFDATRDDMPIIRNKLAEDFKPLVELVKNTCVESMENIEIGGVPVLVTTPKGYNKQNDHKCIYYIHGGGYTVLDPVTMLVFSSPIGFVAGIKTYSIDYRLAPEYPFPAAVDDCLKVYRELVKRFEPGSFALLGDSAGATLSLVTALKASQQDLPLPAVIALSSPATDEKEIDDSQYILEGWDCGLSRGRCVQKMFEAYAGKNDPEDPDISPIYAKYPANFPPTLIITGTRDLFLSNCSRLQRRLIKTGLEVRMDVWEGMWHDFVLMPFIPEAQQAAKEIGDYIKSRLK
ncbi:MAG: alpha/beta hydrolase [Dehalococcoidia bacterium]|nr:alpha/beta hydrolase [Dehalococcoidia bacterium]